MVAAQPLPTEYDSASRGRIPIASMATTHLLNAIRIREAEVNGGVDPLLGALRKELLTRPVDKDGTYRERPAAEGPGHNKPPKEQPIAPTLEGRDAIKAHIDDLCDEARHWLDGEAIANQEQADAIARLRGQIGQAAKMADEARVAENKPFDDGKAEVQAFYNPLIADTKTVKGVAVRAVEMLNKLLTPWLNKLEADRKAEIERLRKEAESAAESARAATAGAETWDEAVGAEDVFKEAKALDKDVSRVEKSRVAVGGGDGVRRVLLKDNWITTMTDPQAALRHYWQTRRQDIEAFALRLAREEVGNGKREIPGFKIENHPEAR